MSYRSCIAGTGHFLPSKVMTNADLEKLVDTNDQWIVERTGISKRHIAEEHLATSDLCYEAAVRAIDDAKISKDDIDLILVATVSIDQITPSTSCMLHSKLGVKTIPCFDIGAACSGFIYALSTADAFVRSGQYKNVLIVGAEILHKFINYKDRETCILFGDGAGAMIISRAPEGSQNVIMSTHLRAEGALYDLIIAPGGGTKIPASHEMIDQDLQYLRMKGREIFKHAIRTMSATCTDALTANDVKSEDVDWLIPHQANIRIMDAVAEHFNFPKDRVISTIHETANTSAASIPIAFDMARKDGRIKRGQTILLTAFGAGLTSGSALLRF